MPPSETPVPEDVVTLDLDQEALRTADPAGLERTGRKARTLIDTGPLRVMMIALAPGGALPEHHAPGPITVQPIAGRIRFTALGHAHDLGPGTLLSVGAGVPHAVLSEAGATFLLTIAKLERGEPDAGGTGGGPAAAAGDAPGGQATPGPGGEP